MNINSKEFKKRYDFLFKKGYCKACIGIITSSYTNIPLCNDCQKIFDKTMENIENRGEK